MRNIAAELGKSPEALADLAIIADRLQKETEPENNAEEKKEVGISDTPTEKRPPYPYEIKNGCLYRKIGEDESKYVSNFATWPVADIIKDDGQETTRAFTIEGKLCTGQPLPPVTIPSNEFTSMSWVTRYWPLTARIAPGNANKDYYRDYIQSQADGIPQSTVYTHTGFRVIEGKLFYLTNGGAID